MTSILKLILGCPISYSNIAIYGNDFAQVAGSSSSCCMACQKQTGCVAATWTPDNGGTCRLKNDTGPIYNANGQFTVMVTPTPAMTYSINTSYDTTNFFDLFQFATYNYNNGFTNFVNKTVAVNNGFAKIQNNKVRFLFYNVQRFNLDLFGNGQCDHTSMEQHERT